MSPDRPPRISDGERDTAVERLKEAFAAGHLSSEEMDERLHVALSAATPGELMSALSTNDAAVDYEGLRADWKQPVYKAPRHGGQDGQDGPRIRIIGAMEYGRLTIRHSRH